MEPYTMYHSLWRRPSSPNGACIVRTGCIEIDRHASLTQCTACRLLLDNIKIVNVLRPYSAQRSGRVKLIIWSYWFSHIPWVISECPATSVDPYTAQGWL